jgi:hypothetical protein
MKRHSEYQDTKAHRNRDKYDADSASFTGRSTVVNALVESVLNPFFVLGRR